MNDPWEVFGKEDDDLILRFREAIIQDVEDMRNREDREEKQDYYKELQEKLIKDKFEILKKEEPKVRDLISDLGELDYPNLDYTLKLCRTMEEKRLWRYFSIVGVNFPIHSVKGRDQKYILFADGQVLGIGEVTSSPMSLGLRDELIGWKKEIKEGKRLQNVGNMAVCVSLFPFSRFTGGKLLALLHASNKVRDEFYKFYTVPMHAICTTSIYGKSVQYDRLSDPSTHLADWKYLGETKGTRTFAHIRPETRKLLYKLAKLFGISHGDFSSESFERDKILAAVCKRLNLPASAYVETRGLHKRGVYFCPFASNWKHLLNTLDSIDPDYIDRPMPDIINYWKERWFARRWKKYKKVLKDYNPDHYLISNQQILSEVFV